MHHDGIHFFPLPLGSDSSTRGLLAMNHEYTDDGLLHRRRHGAVDRREGRQVPGRPRRVGDRGRARAATAGGGPAVAATRAGSRRRTPMRLHGPGGRPCPAADRRRSRRAHACSGTINNCAHGRHAVGDVPHLRGELQRLLRQRSGRDRLRLPSGRRQRRYGITKTGFGYRWHEHDERFDAARHPNEPNRFGWVVEIDPFDPAQPARQAHRARPLQARGRRASRSPATAAWSSTWATTSAIEYIYKFVSARPLRARRTARPTSAARAAARSTSPGSTPDGSGEWLRAGPRPERARRGGRLRRARPRC